MISTLVVINAHFDDGVYPWPFQVFSSDDPGVTARVHLLALCEKKTSKEVD